jgi:hypothetical protein
MVESDLFDTSFDVSAGEARTGLMGNYSLTLVLLPPSLAIVQPVTTPQIYLQAIR